MTSASSKQLVVGIDVGGTNSDLVVIDPSAIHRSADEGVLVWHKSVTTPDVSDGIFTALKTVIEAPDAKFTKDQICAVTVGTTHFINAVIERDENRLEKVAVLRLSGPYAKFPPFGDFPEDLAEIINGYFATVDGGCQVDSKEIKPLNEDEIKEHCAKIKALGITAVAVVGIFSNINPEQELRVAEIIKEEIPGVDVVLSHQISGIGLVERENATILNASVKKFGRKIISSFIHATKKIGLQCSVLISQNDGTVLSTRDALETPIKTFSSGTTNSMRGAAILCSSDPDVKGKNVMVCDIGGTTTDVGLLLSTGFPRQSSTYSYVGGVKMNFSMPHVESIGLGGGSIVRDEDGKITVGPDSTGAEIVTRAALFGGDTITTSDVTCCKLLAADALDETTTMGDVQNVKDKFSIEFIKKYESVIAHKLETVIDRMKTSPDPLPVIFVGGGSFIAPDELQGTSKVVKPPFFQVANAIGAALGKISAEVGEVRTIPNDDKIKQDSIDELTKRAIEACVEKGAFRESVEVVEIISDAVPYVDNVYSFMVKVVGGVDYDRTLASTVHVEQLAEEYTEEKVFKSAKVNFRKIQEQFDHFNYTPKVVNNEWILSEVDIDYIGLGAYILGCGGGGDPNSSVIELKKMIRDGMEFKVITLDHFDKITEGKGKALNVGYFGSPTISGERLHGDELLEAIELMEKYENYKTDGIFLFEIGGGNGLSGIWSAGIKGVPVLDMDLMGRAYPTQWQTLPSVKNNLKGYPYVTLTDGNGFGMILTSCRDDIHLEDVIRDVMYHHGVQGALVEPSMDVKQMREETVKDPISMSWRIGREVFRAKQESDIDNLPNRIIGAVGGPSAAQCIFKGKIVGVEKRIYRGYGYGVVVMESLGSVDEKRRTRIKIPFKNENIVVLEVDDDGKETPLCSVPDLITLVDTDGLAVGTQDYKYGLICYVMVFSCCDDWKTAEGIKYGGPKGFGEAFEDIEYVPIGQYVAPVPVTTEFGTVT